MASQLREVLDRFSTQSTPISLNQMAHEMNLAPAVLGDMIDYWVRKGKLRAVISSGHACPSCGVKETCHFVINLPRYYEIVRDDGIGDAECAFCR